MLSGGRSTPPNLRKPFPGISQVDADKFRHPRLSAYSAERYSPIKAGFGAPPYIFTAPKIAFFRPRWFS